MSEKEVDERDFLSLTTVIRGTVALLISRDPINERQGKANYCCIDDFANAIEEWKRERLHTSINLKAQHSYVGCR